MQSSSSSNVIVGKEYLSDLESRLERVETRLFAAENGGPLSPSSSLAAMPTSQSQHHQQQREDSETVASDSRVTPSSAITFQYEHHSEEAEGATDGIGSLSFADEEDAAFLGPSSNIAFMRHLGPALARISPTAGRLPSDMNMQQASLAPSRVLEGDMVRASRRASLSNSDNTSQRGLQSGSSLAARFKVDGNNAFNLPADSEVRRLMDAYFSNTGLLFPYIHEGTFRQKYDEMQRKGSSSVQKTWLALLNIMLAIAISTSSDSSYLERQKESDIFYRRSIALCREQMLRASNLETVQLQLLTSQYLQGSHKSLQTWMVHGLAVKGALQLGLHCQNASAAFTPVEREFRKRVWYGCILLDRTLSMTFGRPPSIPQEYIKIDLPTPEPPSSTSSLTTVDLHCKSISLLFFNASITLYAILNQTITRCYDSNLGCLTGPVPVTDTINRVYALETQLQDWKSSLPPELRATTTTTTTPSSQSLPSVIRTRFTTVLTLRFLNLRILAHRPILTSILDTSAAQPASPHNPLLAQIGAYNLNCSLESALDIIALVRAALPQPKSTAPLGAWWFTLYYTFNAALVIAATLVIRRATPHFTLSRSDEAARRGLEEAVEALAALDSGNRMVEKCRRHLSGLVGALGVVCEFFPVTPVPPFSLSLSLSFFRVLMSWFFHRAVSANKEQPPLVAFSSLLSPPTAPATVDASVVEGGGGGGGTVPDLSNPFGQFGTSPVGVELGEFMTDMDAEILNLFFS